MDCVLDFVYIGLNWSRSRMLWLTFECLFFFSDLCQRLWGSMCWRWSQQDLLVALGRKLLQEFKSIFIESATLFGWLWNRFWEHNRRFYCYVDTIMLLFLVYVITFESCLRNYYLGCLFSFFICFYSHNYRLSNSY